MYLVKVIWYNLIRCYKIRSDFGNSVHLHPYVETMVNLYTERQKNRFESK